MDAGIECAIITLVYASPVPSLRSVLWEHGMECAIITLVYASPVQSLCSALWEHLASLCRYINLPWCMIGDFNQVIYQSDKMGGRPVGGLSANEMSSMISHCEMMQVIFQGTQFTWEGAVHKGTKILQRLDQAWCNSDWQLAYDDTCVTHLPKSHSDQHPILLGFGNVAAHTKGNQPFRFQACWLEHSFFRAFLINNWQNNNTTDMGDRLQCLASKLKVWNNQVFGNLFYRKKKCLARLGGIQQALLKHHSKFLAQLEGELTDELNIIMKQEEIYWMQKSHLNWLVDGERNTRYFHLTTIRRTRRGKISQLKGGDGSSISDPNLLGDHVRNFYVSLYTADVSLASPPADMSFFALNHADKRLLNCPVSPSEIFAALKDMGPYKAAGPDGYLLCFFQKNRDVVGEAVVAFITHTFATSSFPQNMNETCITLIPKVVNPDFVTQLRPIALSNVLIKLLTKIIVNRLRLLIDKLVSASQSAFIPGRQSSDNIIVVQEVHHYKKTGHLRQHHLRRHCVVANAQPFATTSGR